MISFIFTVPSANFRRLRCSGSGILGMIISFLVVKKRGQSFTSVASDFPSFRIRHKLAAPKHDPTVHPHTAAGLPRRAGGPDHMKPAGRIDRSASIMTVERFEPGRRFVRRAV